MLWSSELRSAQRHKQAMNETLSSPGAITPTEWKSPPQQVFNIDGTGVFQREKTPDRACISKEKSTGLVLKPPELTSRNTPELLLLTSDFQMSIPVCMRPVLHSSHGEPERLQN